MYKGFFERKHLMRIFYPIHSRARKRLRETLENPPKGISYICPTSSFAPDHTLSNFQRRQDSTEKHILRFMEFFQIPNIRFYRNIPHDIDLMQIPGQLLLNRRPHVIELDSIAAVALYRLGTLNGWVGKKIIQFFLRSPYCRKILVISEAAKNGLITQFNDPCIAKKIVVVYPYVRLNPYTKKNPSSITLLFISTNFYLKGGREVLHAFEKLSAQYPHLELIMISRPPKDIIRQYGSWKNIHFIDASLSKEEIYQHYYSQADIYVSPTYQDTFGLVFLEAIASGLPVISTKMFATPEIVEEGKNGFLIDSPISYYRPDYTPNPQWWGKDIGAVVSHRSFPEIEKFIENKVSLLVENPQMLKSMSAYSRSLVLEGKFSEKNRQKNLQKAYQEAISLSC